MLSKKSMRLANGEPLFNFQPDYSLYVQVNKVTQLSGLQYPHLDNEKQ